MRGYSLPQMKNTLHYNMLHAYILPPTALQNSPLHLPKNGPLFSIAHLPLFLNTALYPIQFSLSHFQFNSLPHIHIFIFPPPLLDIHVHTCTHPPFRGLLQERARRKRERTVSSDHRKCCSRVCVTLSLVWAIVWSNKSRTIYYFIQIQDMNVCIFMCVQKFSGWFPAPAQVQFIAHVHAHSLT